MTLSFDMLYIIHLEIKLYGKRGECSIELAWRVQNSRAGKSHICEHIAHLASQRYCESNGPYDGRATFPPS